MQVVAQNEALRTPVHVVLFEGKVTLKESCVRYAPFGIRKVGKCFTKLSKVWVPGTWKAGTRSMGIGSLTNIGVDRTV